MFRQFGELIGVGLLVEVIERLGKGMHRVKLSLGPGPLQLTHSGRYCPLGGRTAAALLLGRPSLVTKAERKTDGGCGAARPRRPVGMPSPAERNKADDGLWHGRNRRGKGE